jgi:hypothetical protein
MLQRVVTASILSIFMTLPVGSEQIAATTRPQNAVNVTTAEHPRLGDIKKIYIAPLGNDSASELIRQKLINRLIKDGTLSVVETSETADAVLTGAAEVDHKHYFVVGGGFVSSGSRYAADGAFRLVDKNNRVLWLDEMRTRKFFSPRSARGASTNLADKIVSRLKFAIEADRQAQVATSQQ